jgi:hypothetical protein
VDSGTLTKMIERLGQLSSEKKRTKGIPEEIKQDKKEEVKSMIPQYQVMFDQWGNPMPLGQQINQKKGVGYGTNGHGDGE